MSPSADHFLEQRTPNNCHHPLVHTQVIMNIKHEFEEEPLDLSTKLDELKPQTSTCQTSKRVATKEIKRELIDVTEIVKHKEKIHSREVKVPAEIKREKGKEINQIPNCKQNLVLPQIAHSLNGCPVEEHGPRKTNGQYISSGLSGGTCKVVPQGKGYNEGLLPSCWNLFPPNSSPRTRSRDSSPIPTVVKDIDMMSDSRTVMINGNRPKSRPNSTPQMCGSSNCHRPRRTNHRLYNKCVLRNVSDLVRKRNELLFKNKDATEKLQNKELHQTHEKQCGKFSPFNFSCLAGNEGSASWNNPLYKPQDQQINSSVASDTVQSRGFSGGTMVSCEPTAQSMLGAIHPSLSINNMNFYNLSFMPNYLEPNTQNTQNKSYFNVPLNVSKTQETTLKHTKDDLEYRKQDNLSTKEPTYELNRNVSDSRKIKSTRSSNSKNDPNASTSNLALLSNVCSFMKDKHPNKYVEENNTETLDETSPSVSTRGESPESELPLKKRKLCDRSADDIDVA